MTESDFGPEADFRRFWGFRAGSLFEPFLTKSEFFEILRNFGQKCQNRLIFALPYILI